MNYVSDDAWLWLVTLNIGLRPTLSRLVSVKNLWNFTSLDEVHADLFFCLSVMSHRGFLTVNFTSCLFSCVAVDVQHEEFYTLCCHKHLVFFLVLEYSVVDKAKSASKCLRVTVYLFCCRYKPVNLFGAHRATPFPYPQPGTSWHCVTTIRASASRDMPVYSPALAGYSLRLPPEGRWLRRRGVWFHTEMV